MAARHTMWTGITSSVWMKATMSARPELCAYSLHYSFLQTGIVLHCISSLSFTLFTRGLRPLVSPAARELWVELKLLVDLLP